MAKKHKENVNDNSLEERLLFFLRKDGKDNPRISIEKSVIFIMLPIFVVIIMLLYNAYSIAELATKFSLNSTIENVFKIIRICLFFIINFFLCFSSFAIFTLYKINYSQVYLTKIKWFNIFEKIRFHKIKITSDLNK